MAKKSILLNNLENRFEILNCNIKELNKIYENQTFDVIITNPPYKKQDSGIINENEKKLISRHEITANLEDFIKISKYLLKDKGELYMVHRPERLVDIFELMRTYKKEPKELKMDCPNKNKEPNFFIVIVSFYLN